jgi:diguanylate cyclase (GGDEF)-like protein
MAGNDVSLAAVETFIATKHKGLRFPAWLESRYQSDISRRRAFRLRAHTLWTLLVYNLFLVPDWFLVRDSFPIALILHAAIVTPWIAFAAWRVGNEKRAHVREMLAASVPLAIVVQILVVFLHSNSPDTDHYQYFILLTVLFTNTIQRLPFAFACPVSTCVVVLHAAAMVASGHMSTAVTFVAISSLICAAYLTLISNYYLERDGRRAYLHALRDRLRHAEADAASRRDALTELGNRHDLAVRLDDLWSGDGAAACVAIVMLDIDHFKLFNDCYGHVWGDLCLKRVASCVTAELRDARDAAVRYGGEEILVLLPDTDADDAVRVAERIRRAVEALAMPHEGLGARSIVTASFGVAAAPVATVSAAELISAADAALYAAKRNGRNQVWPRLLRETGEAQESGIVIPIVRGAR